MYFVYLLQSINDLTYYIGFTKNIEARLKQHNSGKSKYTKGHKPYKLVSYIVVSTLKEAKAKEKYFKDLKDSQRVIKVMGSPENKVFGTSPA